MYTICVSFGLIYRPVLLCFALISGCTFDTECFFSFSLSFDVMHRMNQSALGFFPPSTCYFIRLKLCIAFNVEENTTLQN